jgi:hypothetical protein
VVGESKLLTGDPCYLRKLGKLDRGGRTDSLGPAFLARKIHKKYLDDDV